jgi:excisionase family DNA binding protein
MNHDPIATSDPDEARALREIEHLLAYSRPTQAHLVGPDGNALDIPAPLYAALRQIIPHLLRGDAVSLVPVHQQLTTQQAADFLNVSRPHLVKLLNEGVIPHTRVGSHRRVYFRDVVDYKRRRDAERRKALDEMVALSEELGIYD